MHHFDVEARETPFRKKVEPNLSNKLVALQEKSAFTMANFRGRKDLFSGQNGFYNEMSTVITIASQINQQRLNKIRGRWLDINHRKNCLWLI